MATLIYVMIGYLISFNKLDKQEVISTIIILTFALVAVSITLMKYGKSNLGYEDDNTIDEILIARAQHKKSSWFNNLNN
jgi:hypothetical protein